MWHCCDFSDFRGFIVEFELSSGAYVRLGLQSPAVTDNLVSVLSGWVLSSFC